jgi:GNAT superfamily N-acetyltransferase
MKRLLLWGGVAAILLTPAIAMLFTSDVRWRPLDFALAGGMLLAVGALFELTAQRSKAFRAGTGVAALSTLALIWITAAVGIIGDEHHPANMLYGAVLVIVLIGAVATRFRSSGIARALIIAAIAQALIGAAAVEEKWGADKPGYPWDVIGLTLGFTALWVLAACLFRLDRKEKKRRRHHHHPQQ